MFDDERRSATVEAVDELDVLGIPGVDMRMLLSSHADIAVKLVIALGRRLRAANERLARQSFQTVQSRVAAVLAQLVEQARAEGAGDGDVLVDRDAGRPGAAGGLLARVGQPLPRRARAGRGHLPGPRAADRARPCGAAGLCLLTATRCARPPTAASPLRGDDVLVITPAGKRRVTALPKGGPRGRRDRRGDRRARGARGDGRRRVASASSLGDVEYWYRRGGRRVFKTVRFYLCDFVAGSTDDHDHEVEEARWIPLARGASRPSAIPASGR